ncbi:O-antigen polymerase [Hippea jasoniae]|uniref:O-antigen polymerase n=1 Tax=Hippea jasoniae TaxID=944479 RepID=UPI0005519B57|nr:O-antigen polymerase [Hippea jasoniae]
MITKKQIIILLFGVFATILFLFNEAKLLFYLSIVYFVYYIVEFIRFKSFNIVYLAHVFISIYFILGLLVFNIYYYRVFFLHNIDESLFTFSNLSKVNYIYLISLLLLNWFFRPTKLSFDILISKTYFEKTHILYSKFVSFYIVIYLFALIFSYKYLDGRYIWFIQENKGSFELNLIWRLISSGGLYLSALFPLYRINDHYSKSRFIYLFILVLVFILLLLGIRMYAALLIFAMLFNAQLRGFRYQGVALYLYYVVFGLGILSFAIFRFQTFDFTNTLKIIETIAGEFVFPHSSSFYIIINPYSYSFWPYSLQDLFFQILPFKLNNEFKPVLEKYVSFLLSKGQVAGYGGYFIIGQLYFYFGYLFFIPLLLISKFFSLMDTVLRKKRNLYLAVIFPVFLLILPRMQIWTLKALFYNFFFVLIVIYIINVLKRSKYIRTKYLCK